MNKIFTLAIALVVSVVLIGSIFIPLVHDSTTETVTTDIEQINENPIGDLRLSYAEAGETPLSKTFTFTEGADAVTVSGDATASVPLTSDMILFGTDKSFVGISNGKLVAGGDGLSQNEESVTMTLSNNQANGEAYLYVYYPDSNGAFANFSSYTYELTTGYSVGAFAGVGIVSSGDTITSDNVYDLAATVNQNEDEEYTGITYDKVTE